jgi:hypothetical protein
MRQCRSTSAAPPPNPYAAYSGYGNVPVGVFKDTVQSNTQVRDDALSLTFLDNQGKTVSLGSYRGKKNLVLVFMRGFPTFVCPNCTAQTSRLITNYDEFVKRDAEVQGTRGPRRSQSDGYKARNVREKSPKFRQRISRWQDFRARSGHSEILLLKPGCAGAFEIDFSAR